MYGCVCMCLNVCACVGMFLDECACVWLCLLCLIAHVSARFVFRCVTDGQTPTPTDGHNMALRILINISFRKFPKQDSVWRSETFRTCPNEFSGMPFPKRHHTRPLGLAYRNKSESQNLSETRRSSVRHVMQSNVRLRASPKLVQQKETMVFYRLARLDSTNSLGFAMLWRVASRHNTTKPKEYDRCVRATP